MHGWTQLPSHPILRMQPPPPPLGILHYTIKSMGGFGRTCAVILQACQRETFCSWSSPYVSVRNPVPTIRIRDFALGGQGCQANNYQALAWQDHPPSMHSIVHKIISYRAVHQSLPQIFNKLTNASWGALCDKEHFQCKQLQCSQCVHRYSVCSLKFAQEPYNLHGFRILYSATLAEQGPCS